MSTATATKERPILFNGEMVRAVLNGRKTQTRRIFKLPAGLDWYRELGGEAEGWCTDGKGWWHIEELACPYGQTGDLLWVRETCKAEEHHLTMVDGVRYSAGNAFHQIENTQEAADRWVQLNCYRGKRGVTVPSIHMPRWASRITLEITNVRVERLNDISEEDAKAEGVEPGCLTCGENCIYHGGCGCCQPAYSDSFAGLWNSINGDGSWWENPWLWAIDFKRI